MKRKIFIIIIALVFFILGFAGFYYLKRISFRPSRTIEEKHSIGGEIVQIKNRVITVETSSTAPSGEIIKEMVEVLVTDRTKLSKLVFVKPSEIGIPEERIGEEMKKESFLKEVIIGFEDLRVGDRIEVISERDIRDLRKFTATRIEVFSP